MTIIVIYIVLLFIIKHICAKNIYSRFLFVLYLVCAISTLLLNILDPERYIFVNNNYYPLFFLLIIIVIFFISFNKIEECRKLELSEQRYIYKISKIIAILYFPFTLLLMLNAIYVVTNNDISTYRIEQDYYANLFGGKFFSLGVYLSELSFVPQLLLFENIKNKQKNNIILLLLLFASMSFIFSTLCFMGRDGIVYWVFNLLVLYSLYKNDISNYDRIRIRKFSVIIVFAIGTLFILISMHRFTEMGSFISTDLIIPILDYAGQALPLFCKSFFIDSEYLSIISASDSDYYLTYTFGTFVKNLLWDYGVVGTIIITVLFYLLSNKLTKKYNKTKNIWLLLIMFTLYQIPLYGVFYYRQCIQSMELVYIIFIAICLFNHRYKRIKF